MVRAEEPKGAEWEPVAFGSTIPGKNHPTDTANNILEQIQVKSVSLESNQSRPPDKLAGTKYLAFAGL